MDFTRDYFLCDSCQNKEFTRIYSFSILFHGVNFSDELIYDESTDEIYRCMKCNKTFTRDQIEERLTELRKRCGKSV